MNNGLMLNSNKTQCIFIVNRERLSHVSPNSIIKVNEEAITPSHCVKNLGIQMDRFMLFDKHIEAISKIFIGTLMFISRISANLNKPSRNNCCGIISPQYSKLKYSDIGNY